MADDSAPRGEHPGETAARRRILGESDRASKAAREQATREAMEANRRYGGSREELTNRGQAEWDRAARRRAMTIPETPAGASRPMETARATRIPPAPAAAESAIGRAAGRAAGRTALGPVGAGLSIAMEPTTAADAVLPANQRPRAGFRAAAAQIGRDVGRRNEDSLRQEYPLPGRGAPNPEDYASTSDIVPGPQRSTETTPSRPRSASSPRPTVRRESEADVLNAKELDRIAREKATDEIDRVMRQRVAANEDQMKKGGLVKMAKGGHVKGLKPKMVSKPKMAGGGSVRGCGIAQRGKTRGRVV